MQEDQNHFFPKIYDSSMKKYASVGSIAKQKGVFRIYLEFFASLSIFALVEIREE